MKLLKAPCLSQKERWPTGCESLTGVMLLQYLDIPCTMELWAEKFLTCRPFYRDGQGRTVGPDPRKAFGGSPADPEGMGCWSPALADFLNRAFAWYGAPWQAETADGAPLERLLESVDRGMPVAFWATIDQKPAVPGPSWLLEDGSGTFLWHSNEHCLLLVGYDRDSLWFNDPLHAENGPVPWPRALAWQRHREQHAMAVVVKPR